jgi:DNA-binding LacI/PurR family transcriptional regulator
MIAKTTLSQVARKVGVSASTISRVLNGVQGVNEATRRKVLTAIRTMNYQSGIASREAGQSRLIGFLMPVDAEQWEVRSNFTEEGVRAINDVATRHNYAAMVGSYHPQLGDKAEDDMIARGDFAGALLFRTLDEMRDSAPFRERGIPFLIVNRLLPETSLNYVGADHLKVGFTAATHLLQCGYRRIGLLLGSPQYVSHRLYLKGFYDAHAAAGVDTDPELVTEIELNTEGGYAGTRKLMEARKRPDALIITGDRASLGSLKALRELKLSVPQDVGVLAMDGTRETAFADPPLTAVEIPWYDMLALGSRLLLDLIEHRPPIEQIGICYSTRLIVRESTRPPTGTARRYSRQKSLPPGRNMPARKDG